jgi:hypothetical protein
MRLIRNSGADRVVDELRQCIMLGSALDVATPALSLFACGELQEALSKLARCRLVIPPHGVGDLALLGGAADRAYRNRLQTRWLAQQCAAWLEGKVAVKDAPGVIPQATLSVGTPASSPTRVITGACAFTTEGLGLTPSNGLSLVQVADSVEECALLGAWFATLWNSLPGSDAPKQALLEQLRSAARSVHRKPPNARQSCVRPLRRIRH